MPICRRRFLAAAAIPLAAALMPAVRAQELNSPADLGKPPFPPDGRIGFRVVRKDTEIGHHLLSLTQVADGFDIRIAVEMVVHFGPIPVFRYKLDGLEQWRGGQMVHAEATTNDDGTPNRMRADRDKGGLWVEGSKAARYLAPPGALLATHWNSAELEAPWVNPQNGELLRPVVTPLGTEPVSIGGGRTVMSRAYDLSGDARLRLWYGQDRQWTALLFTADDGSTVRYERS
jgi:hypothetical protein